MEATDAMHMIDEEELAAPDVAPAPRSQEARKTIGDTLRSWVHRYRQWEAPVDIDAADALMQRFSDVRRAMALKRPFYTIADEQACADALMEIVEDTFPDAARDPVVRGYFLERAGYLPALG